MTRLPHRELRRLAVTFAALGTVVVAVHELGLRWQHTESLPRGLYRVARSAPIRRGSIVLWCLDSARGEWAIGRRYLTRGDCPGGVEALGKIVLGMSGDTIEWSPVGVIYHDRLVANTAPDRRDSRGRELVPIGFGRYVLGPRTLWLYSPYSRRSLDSRYFGPTSTASIRAIVTPVLVLKAR